MAEAPARVWLDQAVSDWDASRKLIDVDQPSTFCQSIGKHQQSVEKAIKSVLAALRDKGLLKAPTPKGHAVRNEMDHILSSVRRAAQSRNNLEIIQHVQNLLNPKSIVEINELCALAPSWPAPGALFPRNTEYPFETAANTWIAPSHRAVFSSAELRKFQHLAGTVVAGAGKVVSAAQRKPPSR